MIGPGAGIAGLDAALRSRLAEVPGAQVGLQRGVGVTDLLDDVLRRLRPKTLGLEVGVRVLAQFVLTRHVMGERHVGEPVR